MAQGVGALVGLFVLLWCTMVQGEFSLTLLHTANTDSQVLAVGQFNGPCTPTNFTQGNDSYVADPANMPCVGGVARRAALIKSIRASVENSLLIDGGYLFTGSVFWTLFGTEMLGQYYQEMGYDAIKIDLFEFFGGVDQLAKFIGMVPNTRVVAANLVGKNDSRLANATIVPYAIFTFASGDKVGYAATLVAQVGTRFENSQGINSFDELSGMLQAVGSMLNQGVNKIIVSVSDISMLDSVINFVPGIDIVILPNALYANDEGIHEVVLGPYPQIRYMAWDGYASAEPQPLLVVATGPFGRRLGRLDVTFDDNGVLTSWGGDSILLYSSIEADYQVQQLILSQMAQVEASSSKVVGRAAVDINWRDSCVFGECAIGDWIAEVFRNITGTRIGMVNGGALYGPFAKGDISLGQYLVVFPFGWNFLYTLTLKGENLIAALDNSVSLADQTNLPLSAGTGRFLSVAGLRFTWNPELPVGRRVVDVWVEEDGQWEILDQQQFYSITTLDFVAKGGDSYDNLATNALGATSTQITAATAIEAALAKSLLQPINASVDGRIALSNGTRMTCVAPNMEICSNNGYCQTGVCQCTVVEAAGPYCIIGATTNGTSSASRVAQLVAIVVPAVGVVVIVLLIASVLCAMLIFRLTRKKKEEWDVNFDELELEDRLGEGSFGEVYKGKWKGTEVAVKVMTPGLVTKEMKNNFVDEMRVMSALRHPNVVLFMGASSRSPRMCIIMEYMALGSLYDVLHNDLVPCISMSLSLKIALRAAKGMHFLHSSGIVHRDLKSLNLLLDSKWNVKVSDFGLGKFKAHLKASDGHIGSIPWTAPEVLAEQPDTDFMMADVFSFAVVLFEIVTRRNPYEHLNAAAIAVGVLRDDMRPTTHIGEDALKEVPGQYVALMRNCWHTDAQMRPTFLEIMTRLEYLVDEFPAVDSRSYSLGSTTSFLPPNAGRGSDGDEDYDESYEYRADEDAHDKDARELSEVERDRPQLGAGGAKPPHGEMVIGFTDIANGAALWERDAPAMRDATLVHNDILRKLTNKHGGYEAALTAIGNHGEGAFCVAFQRSVDAIGWATEVQNALLKADWPATLLACPEAAEERDDSKGLLLFRGPRVRMGFHFGRPRAVREPVYRSIQYAGEVVKCAARLAGLAQGGQVLVTERLRRDLAVSSGEVGLALSRRLHCAGRIVLPDSIDKERVFEVRVEGLEARFFSNEATTGVSVSSSSSSSSPSSADSQLLSGSTTRIHRDPFGASTEISFPLPDVGTYASDESAGVRGDTDGEEEESYLSPSQVSLERDVFLTSANLCRWIIRYEDLSLHKQVGVGSYGLVYLARWKGVDVAVKRFIKQKLTERRMLEFRAEVALLAELHHPNIVLFIGACVRSPDLCIVTEFVARGCLRTILSDATVKLSWQQRLRMLRGAALGISYLHSLEPIILHRDLKSSNLLVDEAWNVKVADFGFARIKEENATMTRCGTPCWTAPEVIRGEKYSEKADVYSFGVVVWEVLTRKLPYAGHTFMSVALEILDGKRPEVPAECPPFIADLMQRCWHKREDKRPTMEEVSASLEAQLTGGGGDNV